jgi:hypothetical protein
MTIRKVFHAAFAFVVVMMLVGCTSGSGSGPSPSNPISVVLVTAPPSSLGTGATARIAASVNNDATNGGVTWSVSCGSSSCGSFNPTSSASGASTTYSAPGAVPSASTVTITATSVTDKTKSASATVTITAPSAPKIADGTYVYHLAGQDNNMSYYVAGALSVKNGSITGGEEDYTDADNLGSSPLIPASSSITFTDGNTRFVLATSDPNIGVNGVLTLRGTQVSATRFILSEFDSFGAATGSMDLQTSTATPSGGYAFATTGVDSTEDENQLSVGGIVNISNGVVNTASSIFDFNDANNNQNSGNAFVLLEQSFASGTVSTPDQYGRISISLTPNSTVVKPFVLTGYVLDGKTISVLESQSDSLNADLGGTMLAQGSNAGQFSNASVANTTYAHGVIGQDTNGPVTLGGYHTFANDGSVSGHLIVNDLTNEGVGTFSGATYAVSPMGRVVVSNIVPSKFSNVSFTFILYLDGNGNAVEIGADSIQETSGLAFAQNGLSDYEGTYALSGIGFLNGPTYEQPFGTVGPVSISNDNLAGFTDYTSQDPNLLSFAPTPFDTYSNAGVTGTESSSGLFQVTGLNSLSFSMTSAYGYYPIDSNRVMAIELDNNAMSLLMFERTQQITTSH